MVRVPAIWHSARADEYRVLSDLVSTVAHRGALVFVALLGIAWGSDTPEVALGWELKLELSAAAAVLGGGLWMFAGRYREGALAEARMREAAMRSLQTNAAPPSSSDVSGSTLT